MSVWISPTWPSSIHSPSESGSWIQNVPSIDTAPTVRSPSGIETETSALRSVGRRTTPDTDFNSKPAMIVLEPRIVSISKANVSRSVSACALRSSKATASSSPWIFVSGVAAGSCATVSAGMREASNPQAPRIAARRETGMAIFETSG